MADEWQRQHGRRKRFYREVLAGDPDCYLCGQPGADSVEHVQSRKTHPELIWERSNMVPAHGTCNSSKGSGQLKAGLGSRSRDDW